jgi:ribonuclease-3
LKKPLPTYSVVSREGPAHAPVFQIAVSVEGFEPALGEGKSRQAAEKLAAQALLAREAGR